MNAIALLKQQHREVEALFERFEKLGAGARKTRTSLCQQISDQLAIHDEIEEKIFYPATKDARTEELLLEAVEEHLAGKRIIADIVEQEPDGEELDAKMKVLKEQVLHHVEEEESELFPKVEKALDDDLLDRLGSQMEDLMKQLEAQGDARLDVPNQTDAPARI
ncbi:hemerythrin domain-containing protein [Anaeromyxobacter paludicola]|uniref:Hemerythrin n=1 Tax=Anaeromyxobacter paludicola TaxID=2918171 RepID=A0ABM7X7Z2_9BACT|nr:hemerythrin domain-containing protein [Anaeromyxobacter paludicola]BDG07953.1 hemerythrin [Anaeromyxobacter paludicola]